MPGWKKEKKESTTANISRAAMKGATSEELARAALLVLQGSSKADRLGVWFENATSDRPIGEPAIFHGLVWDREIVDTPPEWERLGPEALPLDSLTGANSVIVDMEDLRDHFIIGPLVGIREALWVPVGDKSSLRGLILAANWERSGDLPAVPCEAVAAELALALAYQDTQCRARRLQSDLTLVQQTLKQQAFDGVLAPNTGHAALSALVLNSTQPEPGFPQALAEFASIGRTRQDPAETDSVDFHWESGNHSWISAVQHEPLSRVWRKAMQTRRMESIKPEISWAHGEVSLVVAIPLTSEEELTGVWIAGLSKRSATLASLERLELRSLLAARALGDIKRSELEVRAEQWCQTMLDGGNEALVLIDTRRRIAGLSRMARQLLGEKPQVAESPVFHEEFAEFFRDRDQERVKSWITNFRNGQFSASPQNSIEALLHNGTLVRVNAEQQPAGEFMALRCEPVLAIPELPQSLRAETELHVVLAWLEEGVVIFDAQENVRALNPRFAQMTGLSATETAALTTLDALLARISRQAAEPELFARKWRELAYGNAAGVREELEIALPLPGILERSSRPILDAAGMRLGRVEIYRDLTARRISQTKLLQTERLAAVGQMVSGVAHELSNPLTTILGYAQRLLMREEASGTAGEARQIFHEAERAVKILRQLQPSSWEAKPQRGRVSLNRMTLQTMEMQRLTTGSENIRTELDLDQRSPVVWGDAGQLQQVLVNLVSNARQAILESGKSGVIRVRTKLLPGNFALLEVSDNGPGIPEAVAARIFDPFFTTKQPGSGTGLGLSIVLAIVREHGGQMNVTSPPSGGTKFSIEWRAMPAASTGPEWLWPAYSGQADSGWLKRGTTTETPLGKQGSTRARVLVVEDEPTVARLIADVLEDEGYQVDVMLSGREALERARGALYDLAICDMKMPGLDGQHFFKALVRAENPLREKLLFVTGDGAAPRTREFLERNQLPHVAKPFRVEELSAAVRKILAGTPPLPSAKATAAGKFGGNSA
jgi:signal transduction histidine kinase/CheY-like chemotaxis protein